MLHTTISCYIVDDEQSAIDSISKYVDKVPWLILAGTATDPKHALAFLRNNEVDCLFADISMGPISGLELMPMVDSKIVFTTAHEEHVFGALGNTNVIDYLVKPIYFDRFMIAVKKLEHLFFKGSSIDPSASYYQTLPIKKPYGTEHLSFDEISHIKANGNYSTVYHQNEKSVIPASLNDLELLLPENTFVRIHRSYIVNKHKLKAVRYEEAELEGKIMLPVGRSYRAKLMS